MFTLLKRLGMATVIGLSVLALTVPKAQAQSPFFSVRPGLTLQQAAYNVAVMGQALQNVPPYAFGVRSPATMINYTNRIVNPNAALYNNPYLAANYASMYGGGYNPYYADPLSASLYGGAQVITAQGKFMVYQQEAFLMREQVRQARLDTRRKTFDEYLYERERTPTAEDDRQRSMREQVVRSLNNPPVTEIYSGKSLNDLLADLRKNLGRADEATLRTYPLPLDEAALKHVNISKGTGNLGLLKNEGRLTWPVALSGAEFKEQRDQIDSLANDALRQAGFGNAVDAGTLRQLLADATQMRRELRRTGGDLTPSMYIEASTFLNNLDDAIRALQQPDVNNFINGKYALKAKTVPQMVKFMTDNGLQFAPAVPGDESAYLALHQSLATYDRAVQPQTAQR